MRYYLFKLEALTPILIRSAQRGSLISSRDLIPATTLGGALVKTLGLNVGDVSFSNAFPITEMGYSMPLPEASLKVKVTFGEGRRGIYFLGDRCRGKEEREEVEERVKRYINPPKGAVKKASGLVVPLEKMGCGLIYGKGADVSKIIGEGDSVAIAPSTKSAIPGLLFHYTYLKEGSKWWGLAISKTELPSDVMLRIGGFRNKGFGKVKITFEEAPKELFSESDFLLSPFPSEKGVYMSLFREVSTGEIAKERYIKLRVKEAGSCVTGGPILWSPWGLSVNFSRLVNFLIKRNRG